VDIMNNSMWTSAPLFREAGDGLHKFRELAKALLFLSLSCLILTTSGFIVQKQAPQVSVRVNYGSGLENLLVDAVNRGSASDAVDILVSEIDSISSRVRSRGFWYMGEGVKQRGTDVAAIKELIDDVKAAMEDTVERLEVAKQEIKLLLQEIPIKAAGMEETLLDILASIRDVPATTELHYRDVITGGFELRIQEITQNTLYREAGDGLHKFRELAKVRCNCIIM